MALRLKFGIVGIDKRHENMKVLGVCDINRESKNAQDVKPPAETLNKNKRWGVDILKCRCDDVAKEQ